MAINQDRGLLDISVELSMRDIMAGNDFALFVFVKNPFTRPIWIRRVHVSLPSELRLANEQKILKEVEKSKKQQKELEEKRKESIKELEGKIDSFQEKITSLGKLIDDNISNPKDIMEQIHDLMVNTVHLREKIGNPDLQESVMEMEGGVIHNISVRSRFTRINLKNVDVDNLDVSEPLKIEEYGNSRRVELESSLPNNTALQPGNTAVYTVVLNVKGAMLFRPSKYRLQFNVNYSFETKKQEVVNEQQAVEDLFINTFAHEVSIRSSIYSIMAGSVLGGLLGGIARLFQVTKTSSSQISPSISLTTLIVAVILSVMAIIFTARKSEAQSFVSVEDFWGGVLIGFLVGYSGTTFFESLTGIKSST
jgi:hypothetical protein